MHRDRVGRRHPAGLHQLRAQRHRRVGQLRRLLAARLGSANHRVIVYQQKCIEPLGESKSDYDIFCELAERLGVKEEFTEGNTFEDWIRKMFDYSDLPKYISFEDFKEKGYFVVPQVEDYKPTPALRWFYEGRPCDTPDDEQPQERAPTRPTSWPRPAARSSSSPRACSRTRPTTTSGRRCRATSRAGRGTRRSWRRSTRCS